MNTTSESEFSLKRHQSLAGQETSLLSTLSVIPTPKEVTGTVFKL